MEVHSSHNPKVEGLSPATILPMALGEKEKTYATVIVVGCTVGRIRGEKAMGITPLSKHLRQI